MMEQYDKIIIGAGIYGLYSAMFCAEKGQHILVLECDSKPFSRATYVNQARVHQGYHYPRSISTAAKSAGYFERFNKDYGFCINREFEKIYAVSSDYSWADGMQFKNFCKAAGISCRELPAGSFFKKGMCDGVFLTREYTYDAMVLKDYFLHRISETGNVRILYNVNIESINKTQSGFTVFVDNKEYCTQFLLNASYASANQILYMMGYERFKIKYELCEIILCDVNENLKKYGFTVMDGPFFSIMPFGMTGFHSLTSVTFTPHTVCYKELPEFPCQKESGGYCSKVHLGNCNDCISKPASAFPYMEKLAKKYLKDEYSFKYRRSLYSMKPILLSSEIDDSRPTVVKVYSRKPFFASVLSGKVNTVYDLDEVLSDG